MLTDRIIRTIARPKPAAQQLGLTLATVAFAAGSRWLVDRGANGAPFTPFLPFVVLATIFLDWPYALVAAILGGAFGSGFMLLSQHDVPPIIKFVSLAAYSFIAAFLMLVGLVLRRTVLELDEKSRGVDLLNIELQHRWGNALQLIKAFASRSAGVIEPGAFYTKLESRLDAMARANSLLGLHSMQTTEIHELVRKALQPFAQSQIDADGESGRVDGEQALTLVLILHELATNAAKYGALSVESGRVVVRWHSQDERLNLTWRELGGPEVHPPKRRGIGSRILQPGKVIMSLDLRYLPAGVECDLKLR